MATIARRLPAPEPDGYRRRQPELGELHKAVREHMATWLQQVDSDPSRGELPAHVRDELDRVLKCRILAHGWRAPSRGAAFGPSRLRRKGNAPLLLRSRPCPLSDLSGPPLGRLVGAVQAPPLRAFTRFARKGAPSASCLGVSCKGRGICPSCGGRRMADTAARWVDRVLPEVPRRQRVLTVPSVLRLSVAWDPALLTEVLSIFQRAISCRLRLLARRKGYRSAGGRHASVSERHFGAGATEPILGP